MNLDTRFERAADGVRTSAHGVDATVQLAQLKQEDTSRRRTSAVAGALGLAAVLCVGAWFGVSIMGSGTEVPPAAPINSGVEVGSRLQANITAFVPEGWEVEADSAYVELVNDSEPGLAIRIGGPIVSVWDSEARQAVDLPPNVCADHYPERCPAYADWLRSNRVAVTRLDDSVVTVGGLELPQLQLRVKDDAPVVHTPNNGLSRTDGVRLAGYVGAGSGWPAWPVFSRGQIFTVTVVEIDGQTYVVEALGAKDDAGQAQLDAALEHVLDSMELPKP